MIEQLLRDGIIYIDYVKSEVNLVEPLTKSLGRKLISEASRYFVSLEYQYWWQPDLCIGNPMTNKKSLFDLLCTIKFVPPMVCIVQDCKESEIELLNSYPIRILYRWCIASENAFDGWTYMSVEWSCSYKICDKKILVHSWITRCAHGSIIGKPQ